MEGGFNEGRDHWGCRGATGEDGWRLISCMSSCVSRILVHLAVGLIGLSRPINSLPPSTFRALILASGLGLDLGLGLGLGLGGQVRLQAI